MKKKENKKNIDVKNVKILLIEDNKIDIQTITNFIEESDRLNAEIKIVDSIKKAKTVREKKTDRQNKICHNVAPSKDFTINPPKLKLKAPKKIKRGPGKFLIKFILIEKLNFVFPFHIT